MSFIGNDILSLRDNSNLRSFSGFKYVRKTLTGKELCLLDHSQGNLFFPYLFWTCKESVYKIALKEGLETGFVPQYFEVCPSKITKNITVVDVSGTVLFDDKVYYFQSQIYPEYISTIACSNKNDLSFIENYVDRSFRHKQSLKAREYLKCKLSTHFNIDIKQFEIYKTSKGIPYINEFSYSSMPDISFSHDGDFFSYAFLLKNNHVI